MATNQLLPTNPALALYKPFHKHFINLIKIGKLETVKNEFSHYLRTYGRDFFTSLNTNFVSLALEEDQIDIAKYILEKFIEEKMDTAIWMVVDGKTVLSWAVRKNSEKIVQMLTAYAADPILYFPANLLATTVYEIDLPLLQAVINKSQVITQLLLQNMTPDVLLKQMLLKRSSIDTILHNANITLEIFTLLLQATSQLSLANRQRIFGITDDNGNTPLHIACQTQQLSKARMLIDHGASLLNVNLIGKSAIDNLPSEDALTLLNYANRQGNFIGGSQRHALLQKAPMPVLTLMPSNTASLSTNINIISDPGLGTIFYANSVRVYQVMQSLAVLLMWLQKKDHSDSKEWLLLTLKNYSINEDQFFLQLQFIFTFFREETAALNQQLKDSIQAILKKYNKQPNKTPEQQITTVPTEAEILYREQKNLIEDYFVKLCREKIQEIFPASMDFSAAFSQLMSKLKEEEVFAEHCCVSIKLYAEAKLLESYRSKEANNNIQLFVRRMVPSLKTMLFTAFNSQEFLDQFDIDSLRIAYDLLPENIQIHLPQLSDYIQGVNQAIAITVGPSTDELNMNRADLFNFKEELIRLREALNTYNQMTWQGRITNRINSSENLQAFLMALLALIGILIAVGGVVSLVSSLGYTYQKEHVPSNPAGITGGSIIITLGVILFLLPIEMRDNSRFRSCLYEKILNSGYWDDNVLRQSQEILLPNERALLQHIIENTTSLASSLSDDNEMLRTTITTALSFMTNATSNLRILLQYTNQLIDVIGDLQKYNNTHQQTISWQHTMFQPERGLTEIVVEPPEPTERTRLIARPVGGIQ